MVLLLLSTGDVPRLHAWCLADRARCGAAGFAPILNFGSSYVDATLLPSNVAMPTAVRPHAPCFDEWQAGAAAAAVTAAARQVYADLRPRTDASPDGVGLVFGPGLGAARDAAAARRDALVPQVVWRGTDVAFLPALFPAMRAPSFATDLAPREAEQRALRTELEQRRWAIDAMWELGNRLPPRWRGVLLTSEAELEAGGAPGGARGGAGAPGLPWADIKFATVRPDGA